MLGEKEANSIAVLSDKFVPGEKVEVKNGPFASFKGTVSSVDNDKEKVKVEVLIFGRSTMVDLTLSDIVKYDG